MADTPLLLSFVDCSCSLDFRIHEYFIAILLEGWTLEMFTAQWYSRRIACACTQVQFSSALTIVRSWYWPCPDISQTKKQQHTTHCRCNKSISEPTAFYLHRQMDLCNFTPLFRPSHILLSWLLDDMSMFIDYVQTMEWLCWWTMILVMMNGLCLFVMPYILFCSK